MEILALPEILMEVENHLFAKEPSLSKGACSTSMVFHFQDCIRMKTASRTGCEHQDREDILFSHQVSFQLMGRTHGAPAAAEKATPSTQTPSTTEVRILESS